MLTENESLYLKYRLPRIHEFARWSSDDVPVLEGAMRVLRGELAIKDFLRVVQKSKCSWTLYEDTVLAEFASTVDPLQAHRRADPDRELSACQAAQRQNIASAEEYTTTIKVLRAQGYGGPSLSGPLEFIGWHLAQVESLKREELRILARSAEHKRTEEALQAIHEELEAGRKAREEQARAEKEAAVKPQYVPLFVGPTSEQRKAEEQARALQFLVERGIEV